MKKHRIFIAVNLPDKTRKKLLDFQKEWASLPVRWTKEANLHITLVFIGYVDDQELLKICRSVRQNVSKYQSFEIKLNRICLGPPKRPARMIWLEGEDNSILAQLKNDLEAASFSLPKSGFNQRENRPFRVHITLARIRQGEWQKLSPRPQIEKEISLIFPVESVEIMESYLSKRGPDYAILESIKI